MELQKVFSLKKTSFHILIWLLLFLLNFLFIKNFRIKVHILYPVFFWLIYALLFYVNYLVLMPGLFFKKRFTIYIIMSIILLLGTFIIKVNIESAQAQKFISDHDKMPGDYVPRHPQAPPPPKIIPDKGLLNQTERTIFRSIPMRNRGPFGGRVLFSLYGLILIYTASISISLIQKWKMDENRRSEIEKENIFSELSFLKQQVNPHFLFNALNSVYSLTINSSKPASEAILMLSSILRYMLYETENKLVNLQNELDIIKDYIALQKLRLTKNVSVNFVIKGHAGDLRIAPLLLLPLIENAFKYGADNVNSSFIDIVVMINENEVELRVKNQIVNKKKDNITDSGIGIKNIKRRLQLLYPDNHFFQIDKGNDIYSVVLNLSL
ncbi:MAG: histidine kinase [Bacteroidales bacterium]|nr:histidine kinase [Bacteroidales bacterium]